MRRFQFDSSILQSLFVFSALIGTSFLLTHCGASSSNTATPATFTTVYTNTLQSSCAGCHIPGLSAWQAGSRLNFSTMANAYSTLYGATVMATDQVSTCGTAKIVVPYSAATSYIVASLSPATRTQNFAGISGCTVDPSVVHPSANLSASDLTNLTGWINAGAQQN